MNERLVIIGGVAAGMTAAARARRNNPNMEIVVYESTGYVSYGACGLPYFIKGEVPHIHNLIARSIEQFTRDRITVFINHEVTALDPIEHTLTGINRQTGQPFSTHWDKLILATGVRSFRLPIPGSRLDGIFSLRTIEDALAIKTWMAAMQPRRAVIIGGSYAGLEMAEALKTNGIETTLIEKKTHILPDLDPDISAQMQVELLAHGVALRLESNVVSFIGEKLVNDITVRVASALERASASVDNLAASVKTPLRVREVVLENETLPADLVIISAGGKPNVALAVQAGITLGPTGAIAVDSQQRTNIKNIWAAGGVSEVYHRLLKGPVFMPTALNANKQGRVAGINAAGGSASFTGTFGASVVRVFDQTLAHTGLTETKSRQCGLDAHSVAITAWSRAAYMPQSAPIHLKLVFERGTQRVLGAQMLGHDGVAKRIDVVSAALQAGWTLQNLAELDTTYNPAEAPVWEPLLVAANVAEHTP